MNISTLGEALSAAERLPMDAVLLLPFDEVWGPQTLCAVERKDGDADDPVLPTASGGNLQDAMQAAQLQDVVQNARQQVPAASIDDLVEAFLFYYDHDAFIEFGHPLPEEVLFNFLVANLSGSEEKIRPLIVNHPDAALLWQGAYPPDVAELLARQYEGMEIARVEDGPDRVLLMSSASPIPLAVLRVNGDWKVDASPIIEFRRRSGRSRT